MSGGAALGHWEVKDCTSHKALSVCKQTVSGYEDLHHLPVPNVDPFAPCPDGWETSPHLLQCYKVRCLPLLCFISLAVCFLNPSLFLCGSMHLTYPLFFPQFLSVLVLPYSSHHKLPFCAFHRLYLHTWQRSWTSLKLWCDSPLCLLHHFNMLQPASVGCCGLVRAEEFPQLIHICLRQHSSRVKS